MHFEGKFEGNEKAKFSGQFTAFLNNSLIFIGVSKVLIIVTFVREV